MLFFKEMVIFCYFCLFIIGCTANTIFSDEPCLPLDQCPQLQNLAKTRQFEFGTVNLFKVLHCHNARRRGKVYLRCISTEKIEDFIKKSELLPSPDKCGQDIFHPKIINGENCELDEFPWIALLKYRDNSGTFKYGCHANLISKKYLLTAAHCVNPDELTLHSVVLGEYDIRNETDCVYTQWRRECADPIKEFSVEKFIIHPDYNLTLKVNDIALLRLKDEVEFSGFIKPICLPLVSTHLAGNTTWWIGGWGEDGDHKINPIKLKAKFSLKTKENCVTNVKLTERHLCVGSTETSKTCPGDSGGPLMMKVRIADDIQVFLIGVNSLGLTECRRDIQLTIFTRTSSYIDWIITNLEE